MCYDITNYGSFQNLDDWYRLVVKTFTGCTMPYVAMVGNKCEYLSMVCHGAMTYTLPFNNSSSLH